MTRETATAMAATTTAVNLGVIFVPKLFAAASKRLSQYTDTQLRQIRKLSDIYDKYCKDHQFGDVKLTENLVEKRSKDDINSVGRSEFFKISGKSPIVTIDSKNHYESRYWTDQIRSTGEGMTQFRNCICQCLSMLCLFQKEREHNNSSVVKNDPVNLFLLEKKIWLIELSRVTDSLKDKGEILKAIESRLHYLKDVISEAFVLSGTGALFSYFFDEKKSTQGGRFITVMDNIHKTIKKAELLFVSDITKESAREHFKNLRSGTLGSINMLVEFLYYTLRRNKAAPDFIISELLNPTSEHYKKNHQTLYDGLLQALLCSESVAAVLGTLGQAKKIKNSMMPAKKAHSLALTNSIDYLEFATTFLAGNLEKRTKKPTIDNLWALKKTGILYIFKEKKYINTFLELCKNLQKLCLCYRIADKFHYFSGVGGDLLIYSRASALVNDILNDVKALFKSVSGGVSELMNEGYKFYRDKTNTTAHKETYATTWSYIEKAHRDMTTYMKVSTTAIEKSQKAIRSVLSDKYSKEIQEELSELNKLVSLFKSDIPKRLPDTQNNIQPRSSKLLPQIPMSLAITNTSKNMSIEPKNHRNSKKSKSSINPLKKGLRKHTKNKFSKLKTRKKNKKKESKQPITQTERKESKLMTMFGTTRNINQKLTEKNLPNKPIQPSSVPNKKEKISNSESLTKNENRESASSQPTGNQQRSTTNPQPVSNPSQSQTECIMDMSSNSTKEKRVFRILCCD